MPNFLHNIVIRVGPQGLKVQIDLGWLDPLFPPLLIEMVHDQIALGGEIMNLFGDYW